MENKEQEELEIDANKIFEELDAIKEMIKEGMCKCKDSKCEIKDSEECEEEPEEEDSEEYEEEYEEEPEEECCQEKVVSKCPYSKTGSGKCPQLIKMYDDYKNGEDVYNMFAEFVLYILMFICLYSLFKNMLKMFKEY